MSTGGSDEEEAEIYNVECVLAESWDVDEDCPLYLIKWEDYDVYESTWETPDSFAEGAEEALRDWEEVKQQRQTGEIPNFDVNRFEEKRARWLKRKSRSNSKEQAVQNKNTTKKFLAAQTEAEAQSDSSEAQQEDTVPRSPPQRKRKRTPPPERANTSNVLGQIAPKPLFNHVSKQKPVSKPDDEVYTMPTKVLTSQTLKTLPKGLKIKIETTRTDSSSVEDVPDRIDSPPVLTHPPAPPATPPATSLAAPPKPLRVLPKYSKTAQEVREQNRLAQEVVRNDGETTREDTTVRSGMIHVSDTIAQRPQALYDLIVKTRETTWSIAISQVAYETTVRTHPSVARDYETLRLKEILHVRNITTEILQMAAQERLLHLGEFDRHVVIADADEQFQYIPSGIEVRSVESFLA